MVEQGTEPGLGEFAERQRQVPPASPARPLPGTQSAPVAECPSASGTGPSMTATCGGDAAALIPYKSRSRQLRRVRVSIRVAAYRLAA